MLQTLLLSALIFVAQAQKPPALSGLVSDATGKPLPGVEIVLTNAAGAERRVKSDQDGVYAFDTLGPGQYDFAATLSGFLTTRAPLFFNGRSPMRRDVPMPIGSITSELTVTGLKSSPGAAAAPQLVDLWRPGTEDKPPAPCVAGKTGGQISEPRKTVDMKPRYPADLVTNEVIGVVVLKGTVTRQGVVTELKALSDPNEALTAAAIEAVSQWRFTPALLNCQPTELVLTVTVNFTIRAS